jgi:hypothetical protein
MYGEKFFTTFSVPYGAICNVTAPLGLQIHAQTCTVAGTINASGAVATSTTSFAIGGGTGGGSGGSTAAGSAGSASYYGPATGAVAAAGGAAGAASDGAGGPGNTPSTSAQRALLNSGGGDDYSFFGGTPGKVGASSTGHTAANPGSNVVLICNSFTGTDGTHTGTINVSGVAGSDASANNTGADSGSGAGVVVISTNSIAPVWPAIVVAGGLGGGCESYTNCAAGGPGANGWYARYYPGVGPF